MSRLPTGTIGLPNMSSGSPYSVRRLSAEQAPRQGVTETLRVPDLATPVPYSGGASLLSELSGTIGAFGSAVYNAGRVIEQDNLEIARSAANAMSVTQQEQRAISQQAKLHARTDAIAESARFNDQSLLFDGTPDTAEQWAQQRAKQILESKGGKLALNDSYARAYVEELVPSLMKDALDQRAKIEGEAVTKTMELYRSMVPSVTDGNELDQIIEDASKLRGFSGLLVQKNILVPALSDIAVTDNAKQFNLVASRLGPEFNAEVEAARTKFIEAANQREKATREELDNRIGSISLAMDNGDPNATFAQQREIINSYKGKVPESYLASKMNTVVREEQQFIEKQLQIQDKAFYDKQMQNISGMFGNAIDTGGVHLLANATFTIPQAHGEPKTIKGEAVAKEVFASKVQSIRTQFGTNVNAADSAVIDLIAKNPTMKDTYAEAVLSGGSKAISVNDTSDSINKNPVLMASYDTFKRWGSKNATIRDAHMNDADRDFFSLTQLIEESSPKGTTPGDAMLKARDATIKDPMFMSSTKWARPDDNEIKAAFTEQDFDIDASNAMEVSRQIAARATVYMALSDKSKEAAASQAAKDIKAQYAKIGTTYINIKGHPVAQAPEMGRVQDAIIREYAAANKIDDTSTYSLTITPSGMWALTDDPEFRMVVPGSPVLADKEIETLVKYVRSKGEDARAREAFRNQINAEIRNAYIDESPLEGNNPTMTNIGTGRRLFGRQYNRAAADPAKLAELDARLVEADSMNFVDIPSVPSRLQPLIDLLDITPGPLSKPVPKRPTDFRQPSGRIDY